VGDRSPKLSTVMKQIAGCSFTTRQSC